MSLTARLFLSIGRTISFIAILVILSGFIPFAPVAGTVSETYIDQHTAITDLSINSDIGDKSVSLFGFANLCLRNDYCIYNNDIQSLKSGSVLYSPAASAFMLFVFSFLYLPLPMLMSEFMLFISSINAFEYLYAHPLVIASSAAPCYAALILCITLGALTIIMYLLKKRLIHQTMLEIETN